MTIKEIAEKYNVSTYTLRYYEKIGLIDPVKKDESGKRNYSEKDDYRIAFLTTMRNAGCSIDTLKQFVDLYNEGTETIPQRQQLLHHQEDLLKTQIKDLTETLEKLHERVEYYDHFMNERDSKGRNLEGQ